MNVPLVTLKEEISSRRFIFLVCLEAFVYLRRGEFTFEISHKYLAIFQSIVKAIGGDVDVLLVTLRREREKKDPGGFCV